MMAFRSYRARVTWTRSTALQPVKRTGVGPLPRRAFTLFEVVIVIGLLTIMAGFAWPLYQDRIRQSAMPESAQRMRDLLFMARAEAQAQHRRVRIRFEPLKQHPLIEIEPDPIYYPNQWNPLETMWTSEAMLLDDVQVHRIEPGRPIYMIPISQQEDADSVADDIQEEEEIVAEFDPTLGGAATTEDIELDEDRPMLIFESDGSTDWATLVLSTKPLAEELEEEDDQVWIVLDGRTGIATIRDKVTEEQLADPEFYVDRDKLELPLDADVDDLSFAMYDPAAEAMGSKDTGGGATPGGGGFAGRGLGGDKLPDGAGQLDPDQLGELGDAIGDKVGDQSPRGGQGGSRFGPGGDRGPRDGRGGSGEGGGRFGNRGGQGGGRSEEGGGRSGGQNGRGGGRNAGSNGNGANGGGPSKQNDTGPKSGQGLGQELDRELADSDLTDQERQNIRNTMGNGGRRGGRGR